MAFQLIMMIRMMLVVVMMVIIFLAVCSITSSRLSRCTQKANILVELLQFLEMLHACLRQPF
jgi:ABC-type transport system involved in cytochrome bd biosynthesis fused ATPase/permease subunit